MNIKIYVIFLLISIPIKMLAWRIEDKTLHLEKGDNIYEVAYSLTGDGSNWKQLWNNRIDTTIKNPRDAYPNMKFQLITKSPLSNELNTNPNIESINSNFRENDKSVVESTDLSESSNKKILGMDYGFAKIMIPVLVTLLTFLLGQFINWVLRKIERINELKSIKTTIAQWIILIKPSIELQIEGCKEFTTKLQVSNNIHPEGFKFTPLLVEKLQQFELREIIDTIVVNIEGKREDKAKLAFNLISQVEFLAKMEVHIRENYEKFHSYSLVLMDDWNKAMIKMNSILNETSKVIFETEGNCQFVVNKNQICESFLKNKEIQPVDKVMSDLIIPLEQETNAYLTTSKHKQLAVNLGYSLEELKIITLKWNKHKDGHIELTESYKTKISESYDSLSSVGKELERSKLNNFYKIK